MKKVKERKILLVNLWLKAEKSVAVGLYSWSFLQEKNSFLTRFFVSRCEEYHSWVWIFRIKSLDGCDKMINYWGIPSCKIKLTKLSTECSTSLINFSVNNNSETLGFPSSKFDLTIIQAEFPNKFFCSASNSNSGSINPWELFKAPLPYKPSYFAEKSWISWPHSDKPLSFLFFSFFTAFSLRN